MLQRKFCDPKHAPLDRLWSTADTYLDLAVSAADATEHFRDQEDREVEKLFWSQFHNPEHPLSVADRLAEWAELNRLFGLAMKCVMSHLWPGRSEPKSYFSLVQQFLGAVPQINAIKRSACIEGARMALAPCQNILGGNGDHSCCIPRFGQKSSTCRALFSGSSARRSCSRVAVLEGCYLRIAYVIVK